MSERYDAFKKNLKASYYQGDNKYKSTVVEAYQSALDVSKIYQRKSGGKKQNDKDDRNKEEEDKGASFA